MNLTKKYTYIDSIRGYAVLMVFSTHVWGIIFKRDKSIALTNFLVQCRMGVMLFFMISALTLFLSLDRKIKTERFPLTNFFIRRFFRIAPLFYIVLLGYVILRSYSPTTIISTYTFTNGFIPNVLVEPIHTAGWTIAIEMIFYLILPALYRYVKSINGALVLFFITFALSVAAKIVAYKYLGTHYSKETLAAYTYYWLPAQLPVFSLGVFLYFLLFKTDLVADAEHYFKNCLGYLLMLAGCYFTVTLSYSSRLFMPENVAFSLVLILFILGMALNPTSLFNNRATQFLGKISYSFYLIHIIIVESFTKFFPHPQFHGNISFVIVLLVVLIITSVISYISYLIIEQPFQKLGNKLIANLESKYKITQ